MQNEWLNLNMQRPNNTQGTLALLNLNVQWQQVYQIDVFGDGNVIIANASRVANMMCQAGQATCGSPMVFSMSFLSYSTYT